jgi:hypothetical protein
VTADVTALPGDQGDSSMNTGSATLASLRFWMPIQEPEPTNYQKAWRGLKAKEIRADLTSEQLLDRCLPTRKRTLGRFTEYYFELIPDYHGISVLAKDGRLKLATEYSCTYKITYFDALTPDDAKEFGKLLEVHQEIPFERLIGRWGWERPRERDWGGDGTGPEAKPRR